MSRRFALSLALTACCVSRALGIAANIDNGFVHDGKTTYCQGVNGPRGSPLEFNALEVSNAGRCPIDVNIDVKATTVGTATPTDVQWAASVHNGPVPGNIFPRAVDGATKQAQPVIASLLRACKAGTNCAPDSVLVPQVIGDGVETGPFDAQGRRPLRPYRFQFTTPGQWVLVGVVTLPGDNALNVSASEFIAFQHLTVVDGVGPATVTPPSQQATGEVAGEAKMTSNINFQTDLAKAQSTTPIPTPSQARSSGGVDASFSGNNKSGEKTEPPKSGLSINMILVIIGGAIIMVIVLFYFVVIRRKSRTINSKDTKRPLDPHSEAGIFRLSHSNQKDMMSSLSMGESKKQMASSSASVYSGGSSERSLAPPRFTASSTASSDGPFNRSTRPPSSNFPSYENASLAASGKEFQASRHGSKEKSRVSTASSAFSDEDTGTFGDLHDSAASLPTIPPKKQPRASLASSVSSYGEYDTRASSRLYSEVSSRGMSEYGSNFSDRASEYSNGRRSTELGALSERGTALGEYEV